MAQSALQAGGDEPAWVIRAQCGDRDALERLLRGVQPSLDRYVRRLVGSTQADDVVQDVLVTIARKLTWLAEPRLFRAWMFRIASRAAFAHLRRERRRGEQPLDDELLEGAAALEPPPSEELLRELLESDRLTPASRAVLALHFQEELPLAEVAAILEIPLGTVKSRLAFGLKALRRHLLETRSP
jgi:RNA polymerase sigma-70 factor (ECF subfamily)